MAKKKTLTPTDLWNIPRVGTPVPAPDGSFQVIPVTTHDLATNASTTRLWLNRAGTSVALTSADASSTQPAISPDGAKLAFVRDGQLHVMPLSGGESERLTDVPYVVIDPKWFPDGKRIAFLTTVHESATSLDGARERKEAIEKHPTHPIVSEDRWVRFWDQWVTDDRRLHVFSIELSSRALTNLTPKLTGRVNPMEPAGQYDIAPDGMSIVIGASRRRKASAMKRDGIHLVTLRKDGSPATMRDITNRETKNSFVPRFSPDGSRILYGTRPQQQIWAERTRLGEYTIRSQSHRILTEGWMLTPAAWEYRPDGKAIIALAESGGRTGCFTMTLKGTRVREIASGGTFAGLRCAGRHAWTSMATLSAPPEAASIHLTSGDVRTESSFTRDAMKSFKVGRVEDVQFKGANGDSIQMFLVHPPEKPRTKKVPLVHLIHGGPHASFGDGWHWRWSAQTFAAQGYLCALVNYHGSDGWGEDFRRSIVGAWGDLSYRDVEAATDWLIERRNVDPKRMAATGGSYGGYMASWIASQTDRYACIVNHAGVCDLQTQLSADIPDGWPDSAGGSPWKDREGMDRFSPMRHADGFSSPMLIIHGEQDYRVPYYQALEIYNAYKLRNLEARLVFYPDENHWILKPTNSLHWYGEVFDWLKRWM